MSFGLAGANRTGKSTLAKAVSERMDIPFIRTDVSGVFKKLNRHPASNFDFEERMRIQYKVNEHWRERFSRERVFITDRTPLCSLAYTMSDIRQGSGWDQEVFEDYVDDCFDIINKYFSTILVVQPGIEIKDAGGKLTASTDPVFLEKLNALVNGMSFDGRCGANVARLSRGLTDLDHRVNKVEGYIRNQLTQASQTYRTVSRH